MLLSESAKYPFFEGAKKNIADLGLTIEDLDKYPKVVNRATERVREALGSDKVNVDLSDPITELLSYPVAILIVSASRNRYIQRRYALAEARRASKLMSSDNNFLKTINNNTEWNVELDQEHYKIHFTDYLKSSKFTEKKWKLVNQILVGGYVYLEKHDFLRLFQNEIEKRIYERASQETIFDISQIVDQSFVDYLESRKPKVEGEFENIPEKYPPCIKEILRKLEASINLAHSERFALVTFLMAVGVGEEEIIQMFNVSPDFNERLTRYYVTDIFKKKYIPPSCATIKTNGYCQEDGKLCKIAKHPLGYYRMSTFRGKE